MTGLKLRHIPGSRSMRILWLLEEIGSDYELEVIEKGTPLMDALNPVAHVPSLRDGRVKMHETGAMTEWICETRAPHLWRSPGSEGRAGWLDWLHFGETLAVYVAAVQRQNAKKTTVQSPLEEAQRLEHALCLLEGWLADSEWLLSGFSGADCHVGYSVWIASHVAGLEHHPELEAYLSRCCARDAFRRAEMLSD